MPLSSTLIGELREILHDEYGVDVGEEEAGEIGSNLVRYFDLLVRIAHRNLESNHPPQPP